MRRIKVGYSVVLDMFDISFVDSGICRLENAVNLFYILQYCDSKHVTRKGDTQGTTKVWKDVSRIVQQGEYRTCDQMRSICLNEGFVRS